MARIVYRILAVFMAGTVMACTCGPQTYAPACERWDRIQAAFLGTVIDRSSEGKGTWFMRSLTLVHVDEAFKGLGENEREVFIDPGSGGGCQDEYDKGKQYVFYVAEALDRREELRVSDELPGRWAPKRKLRIFRAGICSGSREASRLADDLAWLRKWRTTPTRVFGSVEQNFTGRPWRGPHEGSVPLPFAPISLMRVNGNYTAKSDVDGRYSIEFVKPGKYVLTTSQTPWRLEKGEEIEISDSRPCAMRILNMRADGIVRGKVMKAAGVPAAGATVELVRRLPDGKFARAATASAKTDAQGRFVLERVPSAVFAIGVNLVSPPYRDMQNARTVTVAPNGEVSGLVLSFPPPVKER